MEVNPEVKLMQEEGLEELNAFTRAMLVSMLWHGAGLLESDKAKARKNQENANQEKNRNTENKNPSES